MNARPHPLHPLHPCSRNQTLNPATALSIFYALAELLDEREALHKIKKIGSWFTKGVPNGVAFRQKLQQMNEPEVLLAELEALKHGAAA